MRAFLLFRAFFARREIRLFLALVLPRVAKNFDAVNIINASSFTALRLLGTTKHSVIFVSDKRATEPSSRSFILLRCSECRKSFSVKMNFFAVLPINKTMGVDIVDIM